MNNVKRAFQRLRAKTRGLISRGGDGGGAPPEDGGGEVRKSGAPRQLASLGIALIASVAVFAGLTTCETGAIYGMTPFGLSCARGSQIAANLSVAAGVGFLVFLLVEVSGMVFAQLFQDRRDEAAERRAATAELKAEIAKLALRLEAAEQSRRADAAEQSRRADAAERRAEVAEQTRRAEVAELSRRAATAELKVEVAEQARRAEVAEQSRRAEAERAARLELELKLATRNAAKNGDGESG